MNHNYFLDYSDRANTSMALAYSACWLLGERIGWRFNLENPDSCSIGMFYKKTLKVIILVFDNCIPVRIENIRNDGRR